MMIEVFFQQTVHADVPTAAARLHQAGWRHEAIAPAPGARRMSTSRRPPFGSGRTTYEITLSVKGSTTLLTGYAYSTVDPGGPNGRYALQQQMRAFLVRASSTASASSRHL